MVRRKYTFLQPNIYKTQTTEKFSYQNLYKCRNYSKGITLDKVCDEIVDCKLGDDELYCFKESKIKDSVCQTHQFNTLSCKINHPSFTAAFYNLSDFDKSIQKLIIYEKRIKLITKIFQLQILYLSITENYGDIIDHLKYFPNLITLILSKNNLNFNMENNKLSSLPLLQHLDLSFNRITTTNWLLSLKSFHLIYLDLSGNPLNVLEFHHPFLLNLKTLKLLKCSILHIETTTLINLKELREFHLNDTMDVEISVANNLKSLIKLKKAYTKSYQFCCSLWKYLSKSIVCTPKSSLYSKCSNLLSNFVVKVLFWLFGCVGTILNIFSILFTKKTTKSSIKEYLLAISLCDFLTSIYFLTIACADSFYNNVYMENDKIWRDSYFCLTIGIVFQFSLIFSFITVLFLAQERLCAIRNPFQTPKIKNYRCILLICSCIFSLFTAVTPAIIYDVSRMNISLSNLKYKIKYLIFE